MFSGLAIEFPEYNFYLTDEIKSVNIWYPRRNSELLLTYFQILKAQVDKRFE